MSIEIECTHEDCGISFEIDLNELEQESNGSSGSHTTSYTYEGTVSCPENHEQEVCIITDEVDDTGEILEVNVQ